LSSKRIGIGVTTLTFRLSGSRDIHLTRRRPFPLEPSLAISNGFRDIQRRMRHRLNG